MKFRNSAGCVGDNVTGNPGGLEPVLPVQVSEVLPLVASKQARAVALDVLNTTTVLVT